MLDRALHRGDVVGLDVDRAVRAAGADLAHLELEHEVAGLLAEAELLVEGERLEVGAQEQVRRAARAQVLDHGLDELASGATASSGLVHIQVTDARDVVLEPRGDEADDLAVLLGEEEPVGRERAIELGLVRLPARVRVGRSLALGLPELPEPLQRRAVVVGPVTDRHAGGMTLRPVRR